MTFKTTIDYHDILPTTLQGNAFWESLVDVWSGQDNKYLYKPSNLLRQIRDNTKNIDDNAILTWKLKRRNVPIPDAQNNIKYLQFLCDNISNFYRTRGNSQSFVGFLSFISGIKLNYQPMYMQLEQQVLTQTQNLVTAFPLTTTSRKVLLQGTLPAGTLSSTYAISGTGIVDGTFLTVDSTTATLISGTLSTFPTAQVASGETVKVVCTLTNSVKQLDIATLTATIVDSDLEINGGAYYASPYYGVLYDATVYDNVDYTLLKSLLQSLQPVHLVCRTFAGSITTTTTIGMVTGQPFYEMYMHSYNYDPTKAGLDFVQQMVLFDNNWTQ